MYAYIIQTCEKTRKSTFQEKIQSRKLYLTFLIKLTFFKTKVKCEVIPKLPLESPQFKKESCQNFA